MSKYGGEGWAIKTEVEGNKLVSVAALLITAFGSLPASIARRMGYTSALQSIVPQNHEVALA